MIPDNAVEAAAKYLAEKFNWNGELLPVTAREILEAAAPYLMAQAWDEGAAWMNDSGAYTRDDNPYRSRQ